MKPITIPTARRWYRFAMTAALLALVSAARAPMASAQPTPPVPGDFGHAPDGTRAYSSVNGLPVTGQFPSKRSGPNGTAHHTGRAPSANFFLGNHVDYEWDIPPACDWIFGDVDEPASETDCDPGATFATYRIGNSGVEEEMFGPGSDPFIGRAGTLVTWGHVQGEPDFDLWVENHTNQVVYLNLVFDWDQDGTWGVGGTLGAAAALSPLAAAANPWITTAWNRNLTNFPIPPLYSGYASNLNPPRFLIAGGGYHWGRGSITGAPILTAWYGGGNHSGGETEDFLVGVLPPTGEETWPGEYGDAPENALAYPSTGVSGNFPTCTAGNNGYIAHSSPGGCFFGESVDAENDGNADNCAFTSWDDDEKFNDPNQDAGLITPGAWSIDAFTHVEYFLGGPDPILGGSCGMATWGTDIDITVKNFTAGEAYVNVLIDFNGDGDWGDTFGCQNGSPVDEYIVVNLPIPAGMSGPLSSFMPTTSFQLGEERFVWARFTISDQKVFARFTGAAILNEGETEDYLLKVGPVGTAGTRELDPAAVGLRLTQNVPNPVAGGTTQIHYNLDAAGAASIDLFDVAGRLVRRLESGAFAAGERSVAWDGRDESGAVVPPGIYLYRLTLDGRSVSKKLIVAGE